MPIVTGAHDRHIGKLHCFLHGGQLERGVSRLVVLSVEKYMKTFVNCPNARANRSAFSTSGRPSSAASIAARLVGLKTNQLLLLVDVFD